MATPPFLHQPPLQVFQLWGSNYEVPDLGYVKYHFFEMRICDTDMECSKAIFCLLDAGGWIASSGGTVM